MSKDEEVRYLNVAKTAIIVGQVLRQTFPETNFSVRYSQNSMLGSILIQYVDGPARTSVDTTVKRFRAYDFDAVSNIDKPCISDIWEGRKVRWGCYFAPTVVRGISVDFAARVYDYVCFICDRTQLQGASFQRTETVQGWDISGNYAFVRLFYNKLDSTDANAPLSLS